jgi:outer membrane protein assembly factor BamB
MTVLHADDWPHWRGPQATGVSSERTLPTVWSATQNVAWKSRIAGLGISTPIVSGDRVFVTSQIGTGISRQGPRLVQGGDAAAMGERALGGGKTTGGDPDKTIFVVEAFARKGGARLNRDGAVSWQRHLGKEFSPFDIQWGHGSSPVLFGDTVILLCDHPTASYLVALDKRTGKERWKTDRGKGRSSYSTPLVVEASTGPELIVNSSERLDAYDARTGAHLWHTGDSNRFPVPSAVSHNEVIYTSRGYRSGPYLAIKPGGRGDITKTHVLWSVPTGAPYVSSLLHYDGIIYMANDVGVLTAVDAASGERVWQQRVDGVFSASPAAGGGHVYFVSENGDTVVVKGGRAPEIVGRNALGERTLASPAISNGQLFIRSDEHLIVIGK